MKFLNTLGDFVSKIFSGAANTEQQYENLSLANPLLSAKLIIIAVMLGVFVAALVSFYNKNVLGRFVRALKKENCNDKNSAKTVAELGFADDRLILNSLRRGTLSRMVKCVGREELAEKILAEESLGKDSRKSVGDDDGGVFSAERQAARKARNAAMCGNYKNNLDIDRFYLPNDNKGKAESLQKLFETNGTGVISLVLTGAFCIIIGSFLIRAIPWILSFIDGLMG